MDSPRDPADALHLTRLPAEILHHILMWLDFGSVVPAMHVCRLFYNTIKGNQSLCRDIYLLWMVCPQYHISASQYSKSEWLTT